MRANLRSAVELRTAADPITRAQNIGEVPLQTALALMLREKLTGEPIPDRAVPGVELVRGFIEERVGGDLEALALALSLDDQAAFQALSLDMLEHLDQIGRASCRVRVCPYV